MSKFCIDLEGVMLPDVIAAVVEAWYDAQNIQNSPEAAIDQMIDASNKIIEDKQIKNNFKLSISIEKRGGRFAIRGRLPLKSDSGNSYATQRISTGICVKLENIKKIEILTCFLIDQLICGDFSWDKWSDKNYIETACFKIDAVLSPLPVAS